MAQKYQRDTDNGRYIESGQAEMASSPISVRLPLDVDRKVRAIPNRTEFLREAIAKALHELENPQSA
ncbi:hypothetical protein [Myxosarcina sp. GI1]|uniref:hypothetical protein n=1 Tax=Myxosarcina sp. GI1 TaxID=1541065 RepID=UPI00056391CA|nr:hypothetical protein [Myxosarcina sp. GI1]